MLLTYVVFNCTLHFLARSTALSSNQQRGYWVAAAGLCSGSLSVVYVHTMDSCIDTTEASIAVHGLLFIVI